VEIPLETGTSLYGFGESPGRLLRNSTSSSLLLPLLLLLFLLLLALSLGRQMVTWNTDAYGYEEANNRAYQSHPYILGTLLPPLLPSFSFPTPFLPLLFPTALRPDGTAFGVIFDTTWRLHLDSSHPNMFKAFTNTEPLENSLGVPTSPTPFSVIVFEANHPRY